MLSGKGRCFISRHFSKGEAIPHGNVGEKFRSNCFGGKMELTRVHVAILLGSKTYRPSIRKWRYGVRDRNSTVSSASGKSVRWAFPNVATVVEYSQQVISSPVESVFIC